MDDRKPRNLRELLYDTQQKKTFYRDDCRIHSVTLKAECDCSSSLPGPRGPPGLSRLQVGNTVFVDSVFGNDATGALQDETKPYRTLEAVSAAVLPGYLVVVHPGTYAVAANLSTVDNVSWYFPAETFVDTIITMFDTEGLDYFSLTGEGVFRSATSQDIISLSGARADIEFREINATFGAGISIISGEVTVQGRRILSSSPGAALNIFSGVSYITLDKVENINDESTAARAVFISNGSLPGTVLSTYIQISEILSNAGQAIFYSVRDSIGGVSSITSGVIRSTLDSALLLRNGQLFVDADLVESAGESFATVLLNDAAGTGTELFLNAALINKLTSGHVLLSVGNSALSVRSNRVSSVAGGIIEISSGGNISVESSAIVNCHVQCAGTGIMALDAIAFIALQLVTPNVINMEDTASLLLALERVAVTFPDTATFLYSSGTGQLQGRITNYRGEHGGVLEMMGASNSDLTFGSIDNSNQDLRTSFIFLNGRHTLRWNSFVRLSDPAVNVSIILVGGFAVVEITGQLSRTNTLVPVINGSGGGSLVYNVDQVEAAGDIVRINPDSSFDLTFNSLLAISQGRLALLLGGGDIIFSGYSRVTGTANETLSSIDVLNAPDTLNLIVRNLTLANTAAVSPEYSIASNIPIALYTYGILTMTRPLQPTVVPLSPTLVYQDDRVR